MTCALRMRRPAVHHSPRGLPSLRNREIPRLPRTSGVTKIPDRAKRAPRVPQKMHCGLRTAASSRHFTPRRRPVFIDAGMRGDVRLATTFARYSSRSVRCPPVGLVCQLAVWTWWRFGTEWQTQDGVTQVRQGGTCRLGKPPSVVVRYTSAPRTQQQPATLGLHGSPRARSQTRPRSAGAADL